MYQGRRRISPVVIEIRVSICHSLTVVFPLSASSISPCQLSHSMYQGRRRISCYRDWREYLSLTVVFSLSVSRMWTLQTISRRPWTTVVTSTTLSPSTSSRTWRPSINKIWRRLNATRRCCKFVQCEICNKDRPGVCINPRCCLHYIVRPAS